MITGLLEPHQVPKDEFRQIVTECGVVQKFRKPFQIISLGWVLVAVAGSHPYHVMHFYHVNNLREVKCNDYQNSVFVDETLKINQ